MLRLLAALTMFSVSAPALAGATVSAFKKETRFGANTWAGQAAIDGKMETAWMVPGESENRGEWIMLDVPKSTIDKIGMVVGWAKDEDTFEDYARVRSVRLEVFREDPDTGELVRTGEAKVEFEDRMGMQVVDIDDLPVGDDMFGGKVKLTVTDVYPGRDFPNFAVSEVLVVLSEFDAAAQVGEVSGEDDGHGKEALVDDNPRTFWAAPAEGASITFEAPGFSVSKVGLQPGPKTYARPKRVRVTANRRVVEAELPDEPGVHWIEIPAIVGYTGSAWGEVQVDILDVYPGTKTPDHVAVSELDLKATAYEGI